MLSSRQSLRPGVKIVPVLVGKLNRQMAAALAADISWLIASSGINVGLIGCANMGHRGPLYGAKKTAPLARRCFCCPQPARDPFLLSAEHLWTRLCRNLLVQPSSAVAQPASRGNLLPCTPSIRSRKLCASARSLVEC